MSREPQTPDPSSILANASEYDISVGPDGSVKTTNEGQYYTKYGIQHGGQSALIAKFLMAKAVAAVGSLALVFVLSACMHIDYHISGSILLVFLLGVVVYDLVIGFRYLQPHRMWRIIFAFLAWSIGGTACILGLLYFLAHA
jgi:hypothetical protein